MFRLHPLQTVVSLTTTPQLSSLSLSERHEEEARLLTLPGIEPRFVHRPSHKLVDLPTETLRVDNNRIEDFCNVTPCKIYQTTRSRCTHPFNHKVEHP
jgi:hypothetical protein